MSSSCASRARAAACRSSDARAAYSAQARSAWTPRLRCRAFAISAAARSASGLARLVVVGFPRSTPSAASRAESEPPPILRDEGAPDPSSTAAGARRGSCSRRLHAAKVRRMTAVGKIARPPWLPWGASLSDDDSSSSWASSALPRAASSARLRRATVWMASSKVAALNDALPPAGLLTTALDGASSSKALSELCAGSLTAKPAIARPLSSMSRPTPLADDHGVRSKWRGVSSPPDADRALDCGFRLDRRERSAASARACEYAKGYRG